MFLRSEIYVNLPDDGSLGKALNIVRRIRFVNNSSIEYNINNSKYSLNKDSDETRIYSTDKHVDDQFIRI